MPVSPKGRVLPDLASQLKAAEKERDAMAALLETATNPNHKLTSQPKGQSNAALLARIAELEASQGSTKAETCAVITYTPKKGKNAGVPGKRLNVTGNFFPLVLTQDQCRVISEHMKLVQSFGKTGK